MTLVEHLNASTSALIEAETLETVNSSEAPLIVDMSKVTYMSSEGLRLLMLIAKKAKSRQLPLVVAAPGPMVLEVLEVSMFTKILTISPSVEQAIRELT